MDSNSGPSVFARGLLPSAGTTSFQVEPVILHPEREIADLWAEVLELDAVEPDDDFFELGGDSLSAIQILARISKRFKMKLSEAELFTARTPRALTQLLQSVAAPVAHGSLETRSGLDSGPRDRAPATSAQRRFWVLDQLIDRPAVYNVPFLIRLQGDLDFPAFSKAFRQIEDRHAVLRTHFEAADGIPVQVVGTLPDYDLPFADLRSLTESRRRESVRQESETDAAARIPLDGDRLWRAKLYRTGHDEFFLFVNMHHAITDGWSWRVLFEDLEEYYESAHDGHPPTFKPLPLTYGDFADWQHDWESSANATAQVDYWKATLTPAIPPLDLPFAKPRPRTRTHRGGYLRFDVPQKLLGSVDRLCRQRGATRFMVGLAAYETLLHRYTGLTDLAVGSPVANRNRTELEPIVGMFVNTLILRTNLDGDPTFTDLIDRVRQTRLGAFSHQDVSLDTLVEAIRPETDSSRQPFFQTAFYYQNLTIIPERFSRFKMAPEPLHNGTAMFDLRLVLEDGPFGALWGWIEYNADLFDEPAIRAMAGHFLAILESACVAPDQRLSQIAILTKPEEKRILVDWNATSVEYDRETAPYRLIERRAAETPERVAVRHGSKSITYGELNALANRIAHRLRALGVTPDVPVGVCVERTPEAIAAFLGVWKSGGAYLPLDPAFPADRLELAIRDSRTPVVVGHAELLKSLPVGDAKTLRIDGDDTLQSESAENPAPVSGSTNAAYLLYTSGSTGRPNGVVVEHRALANFLHSMAKAPGLSADDVVLAVTTFSFDIHHLEIWLPLMQGASVALASRDEATDGRLLAELLERSQATLMQATPATWRMLFATGWTGSRGLKVLCGGEPMPHDLAEQLLANVGEVWNMYGPTETTVWSTIHRIERAGSISIGKPVANTSIYILDANRKPVPAGCSGEIVIGGEGLARGYLDRPELTAARFVSDPFRSGRMYKTGDLGRWLPDGTLECLGRIDNQVKVRGFRIEIGEIEAALAKHPTVRQAVVQPFRDDDGQTFLAAFVISEGTAETPTLTTHLQQSLPDYMVPARFTFVDSLPLTPNGKVDRKALAAPTQVVAATEYAAPESDAEKALQEIFEEVLKVRPVSVLSEFSDLGGHSLSAAVLVAKIESRLGHRVPLESLFLTPTVRGLAQRIERQLENGRDVIVPLNEQGTQPPLFLIAGAGGHVFTFHKFARKLGNDFPSYGMKAVGVDGSEPPLDRVDAIAARYLAEIVAKRPKGPYILSGYSVGGAIAFELACQMKERGYDVPTLILFDTFAPGYPKQWPLPVRLAVHFKNFLMTPGREKIDYLRQRFNNLRHRIRRKTRQNHIDAPEIPGVSGLSQEVLAKVWASLDRASHDYWPKRKFDGRIVMVAVNDEEAWAATKLDDPAKGWNRWSTRSVEVHKVDGGHMDVFRDGNLDHLAALLRKAIAS
jgi:amino acid adenylation domain-containing protein